jgi:hypothetical protein
MNRLQRMVKGAVFVGGIVIGMLGLALVLT